MNKTLLLLSVTAAMDPSVRKVPGLDGLLSIAYHGPTSRGNPVGEIVAKLGIGSSLRWAQESCRRDKKGFL